MGGGTGTALYQTVLRKVPVGQDRVMSSGEETVFLTTEVGNGTNLISISLI